MNYGMKTIDGKHFKNTDALADSFNTVSDLQNSTYLADGDIVYLNGYYTAGDGANHYRKISTSDDGSGIAVGSLFANVIHDGKANVKWFGAKGDNVQDDTSYINKATQAMQGNELIFDGIFRITSSIIAYSNSTYTGLNKETKIYSSNDIIFFDADTKTGVTVENINFIDNEVATKTKWTVNFRRASSCTFRNCGITGGDGTAKTNKNGLVFGRENIADTGTSMFLMKVEGSRFNNAKLKISGTDCYIIGNELWGNSRDVALELTYSSQIVRDNQLVGGEDGFIKITNEFIPEVGLLSINDNYFDGSYDTIDTGTCVVIDNVRLIDSTINDNYVYRPNGGFIKTENGGHIVGSSVLGNVLQETDSDDTGEYDIDASIASCIISKNVATRYGNAPKTDALRVNKTVPYNLTTIGNSFDAESYIVNNVAVYEYLTSDYTTPTIDSSNHGWGNGFRIDNGINPSNKFAKNSIFTENANGDNIINPEIDGIGSFTVRKSINETVQSYLGASVDINTWHDYNANAYFSSGTVANNFPISTAGFLEQVVLNSLYKMQTFTVITSGVMYRRTQNNGVWGSWNQLATV